MENVILSKDLTKNQLKIGILVKGFNCPVIGKVTQILENYSYEIELLENCDSPCDMIGGGIVIPCKKGEKAIWNLWLGPEQKRITQTLEEYIKTTKDTLEKFENYWKNGILTRSEGFPEELLKGDWDEQFDIFRDNEKA